MSSRPSLGFRELGKNVFGDGIQPLSIPVKGVSASAPTSAMGWREYWDRTDITKSFSDDGITPVVADDAIYRTNGTLGIVANSQLTQATLASRPQFKVASPSNYALHDNSNDFMTSLAISNFMANNAATMLMSLTILAGWTTGEVILRDSSSNFDIRVSTGNLIIYRNFSGAYQATLGQPFVDGTPIVYACKHIGGNIYDSINGAAWSAAVVSGNSTVTQPLQVGGGGGLNMHMRGLALANVEISDANLQMCISYLKNQAGI